MRLATLLLVGVVAAAGCGPSQMTERTFDQELELTLRAGRGQLTEMEKKQLLKENHPILAQVGDPQAFKLVELFSRLPESERRNLLEDSYVKWRMVEFDQETQELYRQVIDLVLKNQTGGFSPFEVVTEPAARSRLFDGTEVGFAVVELGKSRQKVVSWFAFGPKLSVPLWVTIVNSDAANSDDYVQSHMQRLPLLRPMKHNSVPKLFVQPMTITSMV
jgi:hypothetical protein